MNSNATVSPTSVEDTLTVVLDWDCVTDAGKSFSEEDFKGIFSAYGTSNKNRNKR